MNATAKFRNRPHPSHQRQKRRCVAEALEGRLLFSVFTPSQIRHAYGFDNVNFGVTAGTGSGQTIAIVDPYHDPNIASDLASFDQYYGIAAPPSFQQVTNPGSSPGLAPPSGSMEIALDVEWAHALAPSASILLVEANFDLSNLCAAASYAANQSGVSAVSMSWGAAPDSSSDSTLEQYFTGHSGVTFVASTGDAGNSAANSPEYPSTSPNVLAVGGTVVTLDGSNNITNEIAWKGSGGGKSNAFQLPTWQSGVTYQGNTSTTRMVPDVSFSAGFVNIIDSYGSGGSTPFAVCGTSFSAPAWAALIAITNQGRAINSLAALNGPTETLPLIYQLPSSAFRDITTGGGILNASDANITDAYPASTGYDLLTGRGSPIAPTVAADLVQAGQDMNFVKRLYLDVLHRSVDSTWLMNWTGQILGGTTRTSVAFQLLQSTEYRTDLVQSWYQAFLGRTPSQAEINIWLSAWTGSTTDESVIAQLMGSTEFYNDANIKETGFAAGNDRFIDLMYVDLLARTVDSSGLAYFETYLQTHTDTAAATALDTSSEYRTDLISYWYTTYFRRSVDQTGINTWLAALNGGSTDETVISDLLGSTEYFNYAQNYPA